MLWCGVFAAALVAAVCGGCLLYGWLLCPHCDAGICAVVWAQGDGEGVEQRVRCLMWLHRCGLLRCTVAVADTGLSEEGQQLVALLMRRYPTLCQYQ